MLRNDWDLTIIAYHETILRSRNRNRYLNMPIKSILLVSGPSGCGKSTFIRQLLGKTIQGEIPDSIPFEINSLPIIEANDILKGSLSDKELSGNSSGIILHYDIVLPLRYRIDNYVKDPSLNLLSQCETLHIIFIRPPFDTLRKQFSERLNNINRRKSPLSRLWTKVIRLPVRRLINNIKGKTILNTKEMYKSDEWLTNCYSAWEKYIREAVENHTSASLTIIEPDMNQSFSTTTLPIHEPN